MKIVSLVIVLVVFGFLALGFFKYTSPPAVQKISTPASTYNTENLAPETASIPQSTVSANIPPDWKIYKSSAGFSMAYPTDMKTDQMAEGERFYKLGPTQSTGTELYDGISLLIRTGDLANLSLKEFVDKKHQQMTDEETTREITDPVSKKYGSHQAIQFRHSSFGEGEFIYLQIPGKKYLEIINMTVEPKNREQTYQKIVEQMISSISF